MELKAKHTHIPFDAILNPSDYFINLYPCFKDLFKYDDQKQSRIEYVNGQYQSKLIKGLIFFAISSGVGWVSSVNGLGMMKRA